MTMADIKQKKKRKNRSKIKFYRRTVQIGVALVFILIPWLNSRHISIVQGNFLSFNLAGFPLADPLAVLQSAIKNAYLSADLLMGAGLALAIALILGTVFCSWVCPFGLFSDYGQALGLRLKKKSPEPAEDKKSFIIKLAVFIAGLAGFFAFSTTPVLNQLSMPAWYSRIFQFIFVQKFFSLAILVYLLLLFVEIIFQKRIWCRYLCPQSVLLILFKQLNPKRLKVNYHKDRCFHPKTGREPCVKACNKQLDPRFLSRTLETECTNCGDCITICSGCGSALKFGF
jgi:ferredoxin-type protein NapH